jgi:uncharacterized protein
MIINLESLNPGTQLISGDEEVKFGDVDGNENKIDCHVELTVRKTNEAIFVHAELTGEMLTSCHKCLEPARCHLDPSFDVVFRKMGSNTEATQATGDEDLIYIAPDENQVSLDRQIYESLMVSVPIRIVCRDDCKGLCSRCGANLNLEPCSCTDDIDPRWEALRKLKNDKPEE